MLLISVLCTQAFAKSILTFLILWIGLLPLHAVVCRRRSNQRLFFFCATAKL